MKPVSGRMAAPDVRAVVTLVADIAAMKGGQVAKQRALMSGLAVLIGADSWVWCYCPPPVSGEPPRHILRAHAGLSETEMGHWLNLPEHPEVGALSAAFFGELTARGKHLTRTQPQLDPEGRFYHAGGRELFARAGIGAVMLSHRPMPDGAHSVVSIYRKPGSPHFDARESRLVHIVLSEVDWLHRDGWEASRPAMATKLSARERMVFNALIDGRSRARIATDMAVSSHTANDYTKAVYRKFGVNGRLRLLARFRDGDGGDV